MSGPLPMFGLPVVGVVAFLQAGAQPMPPPIMYPNVSLWHILAWAALNPATITVGLAMGRRTERPTQVGIAAFAAALAGIVLLWVAARFGLDGDTARGAVGVFITALPFGLLWSWIGSRRRIGKANLF